VESAVGLRTRATPCGKVWSIFNTLEAATFSETPIEWARSSSRYNIKRTAGQIESAAIPETRRYVVIFRTWDAIRQKLQFKATRVREGYGRVDRELW
jgi:hypothetical protein